MSKICAIDIKDHSYFQIGREGVTDIVLSSINGEMAHIPWLEVYTERGLHLGVRMAYCIVYYEPEKNDENPAQTGKESERG